MEPTHQTRKLDCFVAFASRNDVVDNSNILFFVESRRAQLALSYPSHFVGRVAHRERRERCDGWGWFVHARVTPTRLAFGQPPSPQVGGMNTADEVVADAMTSWTLAAHLRDLAARDARVLDM